MRIGVNQLAPREQRARLGQCRADRIGRFVDVEARKQGHPCVERPVVAHGVRHFETVRLPQREVVVAMSGRDMHETRARLCRDEIRKQNGRILLVAASAQGVGANGARELSALEHVHEMMRRDPGIREELRQ